MAPLKTATVAALAGSAFASVIIALAAPSACLEIAGLELMGMAALIVFERGRYSPETTGLGGMKKTGERFRDPTTGEDLTVYADPTTGERAYVPTRSRP